MIQSWQDIRSHYANLLGAEESLIAMVKLVEKIQSSPYHVGLFAWTSMLDLCIVQTPVEYPYNGPYLRIAPIKKGELEFRYIDTAIKEKQWHRVVDGNDAFVRLELFIKQLHWFG